MNAAGVAWMGTALHGGERFGMAGESSPLDDDRLGAERATAPITEGGESSATLDAEPVVVNGKCGICTHTIANSAWVTHHGLRCHVSCWLKTGEAPDAVAEVGKYGPGGDYFEAAKERIGVATGWKS